MTTKQYKKFEKEMEARGYKLYNRPGTIKNEHYYYCKGFCYDYRENDPSPGYQLLFLVYDWRDVSDFAVDDYGIQPLIITSNKKYSRIDLTFLPDKINVKEIEEYAEDFYHQFVLQYDDTSNSDIMRINEEVFAEKCDQEKTILFSKMLTEVDYDQQASEMYQTFINEHAEYRFKSHYYVKKEEGEEDYYGHFGGEKRYIIIVKD